MDKIYINNIKLILSLVFLVFTIYSVKIISYGAFDNRDKNIKLEIEKIQKLDDFNKQESVFSQQLSDYVNDFENNSVNKIVDFASEINKNVNSNKSDKLSIKKIIFDSFKIISYLIILFSMVYFIYKSLKMVRINKYKYSKSKDILFNNFNLEELKNYFKLSDKYYKKSDFKKAINYLYLGLVSEFSKKGLISQERSKTNEQYLRELIKNNYSKSIEFQKLTKIYNEILYSNNNIENLNEDYILYSDVLRNDSV